MNVIGIVLFVLGLVLIFLGPRSLRPRLGLTGLRIRGLAGPVLIIIGILMITGAIQG